MTTDQKLQRMVEATKGALAALSQKKTYPADIEAAKGFLRDALRSTGRG